MKITMIAHYDQAGPGEDCWWAESPDLPGFTAVYPSLGELRREAQKAVEAMDMTDGPIEFSWTTDEDAPEWATKHVSLSENQLIKQKDAHGKHGPGRILAACPLNADWLGSPHSVKINLVLADAAQIYDGKLSILGPGGP